MRFTAYNHYVHKMLDRWGPNVKETTAIKKYLKSQNVDYTHPPWVSYLNSSYVMIEYADRNLNRNYAVKIFIFMSK
jgi:hypothetical protein